MNLLVFSAYYEPEVAASLYLSKNLYEDFASNGMNVRLFVPTPTRGVTPSLRKQYKKNVKEIVNERLTIERVKIPKEFNNSLLRAIRYLWMNIRFIIKSLSVDADAIFVQSTPPTQGAMAALIKKIKHIPFIYNLQDVFPDSMVNSGMIKRKSIVYKIGRIIEDYTYRNADTIVVISNDIKHNLVNKGVPAESIIVIPNWIESDKVFPIEKKDNYLFEKYNICKNNFNVVYAGNLGYAQNISVIIRAAKLLSSYDEIQFIVFGNGSLEDDYKCQAKELDNVSFYPLQPYSEVAYVYSLGDVSIVSCKEGFGESAMPSKTWNIMATGTPVLASFDANTDLEQIIVLESVGLFSEADNEEQLACNILDLFNNENKKTELGNNGYKYIQNNLTRELCTKQYVEAIVSILDNNETSTIQ